MKLAKYIDHTLLKPQAVVEDIIKLCTEAKEHQFAAVCVNPCYVDLAAHLLQGTGVHVATVIGFPLGANTIEVKVFETQQAVLHKADEIDMVINIGAAQAGQWEAVKQEIERVVEAADGHSVKVIIETSLLTDEQKRRACQAALKANAHYVKTSTGFSTGGATPEDIKLMKEVVGNQLGIKASGGIRNKVQAELMIAAGATRIGTSAGVEIVK